MIEKTCRTCGYVGPVEDFVKQRRKCKKCQSEYNRIYSKQWRADNQEKIKEDKADYYAANAEDVKLKAKQWRDDNPEQKKINDKKWRDENLEHKRELDRKWAQEHSQQKYDHEKERRRRKAEIPGVCTDKDVDALYVKQGGRCTYCQEKLGDFHVDHIIPVVAEGCTHWPSNRQLLCPFCNVSKGKKSHEEYLEYRRIVGLPVFDNREAA